MSSTPVNPLTQLVIPSSVPATKTSSGSLFEALARAWGDALDRQAQVIQDKALEISEGGNDKPGALTELSAESAKIAYMANSSHTSISSVGEAHKTSAQK
jgi:hypothetical protein